MEDSVSKESRIDLEKLLEEGVAIQIKPQGYSMYPVLVPGRDAAVIEPADPVDLKRGDVVLYRREGSILVLHRIWKHGRDGFYFVGDNQVEVEGPLRPEQIKGRMTFLIRNGKHISVKRWDYRLLTGIWLWMRPVRHCITRPAAWLKRQWRRLFRMDSK